MKEGGQVMGSRKTETGVENVYAAAQIWVDEALRTDGSLFTQDAIWTVELLEDIQAKFLNRPYQGREDTFQKLQQQLEGSRPEVYQLAAETLYFQYLIHHESGIKGTTKQERVNRVLGWPGLEIAIPGDLIAGLTPGIARVGPSYSSGLPFYLGFLIEFVGQWKGQPQNEQERLLRDPWAFKEFATNIDFQSELLRSPGNVAKTSVQRHAILHLVYPDTFEQIVSGGHKTSIVKAKAFADFCEGQEVDVDRKVQQIRRTIEEKKGGDFDFYDEDISPYWKPPKGEKPVEVFRTGGKGNQSGGKGTQPSGESLQALAAELYLSDDKFLKGIVSLLAEKRQVIFQGPPGTGKTYVARKLARHLAGSAERVSLVQFHPSYAYEDFVQGFRPKRMDGGQVGFELRKGPLLRAAERAQQEPEADHYLIIDEINRGNLATVFGELYFLLEYRDAEMRLQYSDKGEEFALPKNLFIIGTMNTADRSIAMVDLALRRRFYFVEFLPEEEPVKGLLGRYLEKNRTNAGWVVDVVDKANGLLKTYGASDAAIGPSYFMQKGLTPDKVALIWKHSVLPYIEERLFNDRERLAEFDLEKLRNANAPAQTEGV